MGMKYGHLRQAIIRVGVAIIVSLIGPTVVQAEDQTKRPQDGTAYFEFFTLAPGKHEEFIRSIAEWDKVSAAGGVGPTQLYFHKNGGRWDVLLFKPTPEVALSQEQIDAMDAKRRELGLPTGPEFYLAVREMIATQTVYVGLGPISADEWLQWLDETRAEAETP